MNRLTLSEQTQHPTKRHTVVCVTNQFHCERLIRAGRLIAELSKTSLLVINVSSPDLSENDAKALEYLFQVSKENGAQMTVLYSDEPMRQLTKFIKENKAVNVVTGMAAQQNSPLPDLWRKFTSAHFFTVTVTALFQNRKALSRPISHKSFGGGRHSLPLFAYPGHFCFSKGANQYA